MFKPARSSKYGTVAARHDAVASCLEALEPRRLLAAVSWDGGGDGTNWNDAANWSTNALPTADDDVTIDVAQNPLIRLAGARGILKSLNCAEQLRVVDTYLDIYGDATVDGTITLGETTFPTQQQAFVRFTGALSHSLSGAGIIDFAAGDSGVYLDTWYVPDRTLTIGSEMTIRLTGATEGHVRPSELAGRGTITNLGRIEAAFAGGHLEVGGYANSTSVYETFHNQGTVAVSAGTVVIAGTWDSAGGTLDVDGGTLVLQGHFGSSDVAAIDRVGGEVLLQGSLFLSGGPLELTAATDSFIFNGYIIGPGSINASGGAQLFARWGTLIDVTLNAPATIQTGTTVRVRGSLRLNSTVTGGTIDTAADGPHSLDVVPGGNAHLAGVSVRGTVNLADADAVLRVSNGLTLNGTVNVMGSGAEIVAVGTQTWAGGTIALGNATAAITLDGAGAVTTLTNHGTIRGYGRITTAVTNTHAATLANGGTVKADLAGQALAIESRGGTNLTFSNLLNLSTVAATDGGTLRFAAAPLNYNPGTHELTGGTWSVGAGSALLFPTTADIRTNAATVVLAGAGSEFPALAALMQNTGTLQLAGGRDLTAAPAGGTFTNDGTLRLGAGSEVSVSGAFTQGTAGVLHTLVMGQAPETDFGRVIATHAVSLAGTLRPALNDGPQVYVPPATATFTIVSGASRAGTFDAVSPFGQAASARAWYVTYDATSATLGVSAAAPSRPDMSAGSDGGVSVTDNITSDATPTFTGSAPADAVDVKLYVDNVAVATAAVGAGGAYSLTPPPIVDGSHTVRATSVDADGQESLLTSALNVIIDTASPTAALTIAPQPVPGTTSTTFTVTFTDGVSALWASTFGTGDVRVTGPHGFDQLATFVSVDTPGNGSPRAATYSIDSPGGTWDSADAGAYEIHLRADEVSDVAGKAAPAQPLGAFEMAPPPRVTDVFIRGSAWTPAFLEFLASSGQGDVGYGYRLTGEQHADELPWTNLKWIIVEFSTSVNIDPGALRVFGVNTPEYVGSFHYDSSERWAIWRLSGNAVFGADKLLLSIDDALVTDAAGQQLDGEWTNPAETTPVTSGGADAFPSGDGTAGGDFLFRMNVLPGDVNGTGGILGSDVTLVRNAQGFPPGAGLYTIFKDVNGSGGILGSDVTLVRNRQGTALPAGEPAPPAAEAETVTITAAAVEVSSPRALRAAGVFASGPTVRSTMKLLTQRFDVFGDEIETLLNA